MPTVKQSSELLARLQDGAKFLGISLSDHESVQLLRFIDLLLKWNQAYNLTALRDPMEMLDGHLLDSMSVLPFLQGRRILDMGTGAGLPGIPLAMLRPVCDFVLLDSNSKKIRFVRQVKLELALDNILPVHARVEQFHPEAPFDTLIARAFTSLPRMFQLTRGLLTPTGCLLAMKGSLPREELDQLPKGLQVRCIRLHLPFSEAERHLIELRQGG